MKLEIEDIKKTEYFVNIFKYLSQISKNVNIYFMKEKMFIQTMDDHHVCMFELYLQKEWFSAYEITDTDDPKIGINTEIMSIILKCKEKNHKIILSYEGSSDILDINFTGDEDNIDKEFSMPLMVIDTDIQHFPVDVEWNADFEIKSSLFQKLTTELSLFNDDVIIQCNEETISLSAQSLINGKYTVKIDVNDLESYSIDENMKLNISYSLKYFTYISNFSNLCDSIYINVSDELPLKVNCYLGDKENYIRFYLAPKITDDDE